MNELKRALPVLVAHYIVGLLFCFAWFFFRPLTIELIRPFNNSYKIGQAILLFKKLVPSLFISGILLGYSIAFGKFGNHSISRWSSELLESLKGAFILAIVTVSIFIVLAEGIGPFIESKIVKMRSQTEDYMSNIYLAHTYLEQKIYADAELHAQAALQIWKTSPDAQTLLNKIQYLAADKNDFYDPEDLNSIPETNFLAPGFSNLSVLKTLEIAQNYLDSEDYFSAHYYAMLANKVAENKDPNKQKALRIAADAWNNISEMPDTRETRQDTQLFYTKRKGYDAIQREDWLTAYYIFTALQEEDALRKDNKVDPDIVRLLSIAEEGLNKTYFFLDETLGIEPFESAKDVFFIIDHTDGSTSIVFFKGFSYKKESGKDMAYLRGFEYAKINVFLDCESHISVPYAKLIPFINEDKSVVPFIQLKAVDKKYPDKEITPKILVENQQNAITNTILLDMPFTDINLILAANRGVKAMTLAELIKFKKNSETYGFSRAQIQHEIIYRLSQPFLILILSVFAINIAWKFRFSTKIVFKAWWFSIVPMIPLTSWFFVETARYSISLISIPLIAWFQIYPELITFIALALIFLGTSIMFFGQRGD